MLYIHCELLFYVSLSLFFFSLIYFLNINKCRFNLEAHLVHESDDGKTAVIGIMYKIGRPDSFLSMVNTNIFIYLTYKDY